MLASLSICPHCCPRRTPADFALGHSSVRRAAQATASACVRKCNVPAVRNSFENDKRAEFVTSGTIRSHGNREAACRCQVAKLHTLDMPSITTQKWDKITTRCVELSTVAFVFLLMPQVIKNYLSMARGNTEALAVLSWVGYLTSLFGNVLLLGCFVDKGEGGATAVQAIGAVANYAMLGQIWMANLMPSQVFIPLSMLMGSAAIVNACKFWGALDSKRGSSVWQSWQDFLGVLGIAMLPQAIWAICSKHHTKLPATVSSIVAVVYLVLARQQRLSQGLQRLWSDVPAWTATLLFMFQPVAQSVSNFSNPSTLQGLSTASILLGMLGNGLMVPRALFTADKIWFIGVGWGPLTGWVQLLSMYMGRTVAGVRFLPGSWLMAISLLLLVAAYTVLNMNAAAKGLHSPVASVSSLFQGRHQELQYAEKAM